MLAEVIDAVVGVDTHRDTHEVEIAFPTGTAIATCSISNDSTGYADLLAWTVDHAPGPRLVVSIEGTRSYGVGLARAVAAAGLVVVECEQPHRKTRRGKGKSDAIDAHLAVLSALRLDADRLPSPRADGDREALRILLGARQEPTTASTGQTNRLRALLAQRRRHRPPARPQRAHQSHPGRPGPPPRNPRRRPPTGRTPRRDPPPCPRPTPQATRALTDNRKQLLTVVNELAPGLTDQPGIGPISAAQAIVSFSHPGRCRNEAAFAALDGTSPLQASSGRTVRHRLNRGGDRALNRAIHTIATTRMRSCPTTQAYVARRTAQGKTTSEIRRCLKRYVARQLYRALTAAMTPIAQA